MVVMYFYSFLSLRYQSIQIYATIYVCMFLGAVSSSKKSSNINGELQR